jgi:hypothetical protein
MPVVVAAVVATSSCTSAPTPKESAGDHEASCWKSFECAVTTPNGSNPPGQRSRFSHGSGKLWVELWPHGHVRASDDDVRPSGSIAIKFPWTRGVEGKLEITGRRLDAEASSVRAIIPKGYGRTGFQSTAIIFPTQGCWKITGHVGRASLTFVTKVTKPNDG